MKKKMSFFLRTLYLKGRCLEQAQSSVLDAAMETGSGTLKAKKKNRFDLGVGKSFLQRGT